MTKFPLCNFQDPEYQGLIQAADQYSKEGQFHKAKNCFLNAIQLQSTISLRTEYAIFLRNYGYHQEAVLEFKQLHQESLWNQDAMQTVLICKNLCSCLIDQNKHHEAEIYHQQSLSFSDCSDPEILLQGFRIELEKKNWEAAEKLLNAATRLSQIPEEKTDIIGYHGMLQLKMGETLTAVSIFWKAFLAHRNLIALEEAGIDLMNLAEISRRVGRARSEKRFLLKANEYFHKAGIYSESEEIEKRIKLLNLSIHIDEQIPEWN